MRRTILVLVPNVIGMGLAVTGYRGGCRRIHARARLFRA